MSPLLYPSSRGMTATVPVLAKVNPPSYRHDVSCLVSLLGTRVKLPRQAVSSLHKPLSSVAASLHQQSGFSHNRGSLLRVPERWGTHLVIIPISSLN